MALDMEKEWHVKPHVAFARALLVDKSVRLLREIEALGSDFVSYGFTSGDMVPRAKDAVYSALDSITVLVEEKKKAA